MSPLRELLGSIIDEMREHIEFVTVGVVCVVLVFACWALFYRLGPNLLQASERRKAKALAKRLAKVHRHSDRHTTPHGSRSR